MYGSIAAYDSLCCCGMLSVGRRMEMPTCAYRRFAYQTTCLIIPPIVLVFEDMDVCV